MSNWAHYSQQINVIRRSSKQTNDVSRHFFEPYNCYIYICNPEVRMIPRSPRGLTKDNCSKSQSFGCEQQSFHSLEGVETWDLVRRCSVDIVKSRNEMLPMDSEVSITSA